MTAAASDVAARPLGRFHQLFRFILIGGGCAVIDYGVYIVLSLGIGWPFWLAKAVSFCCGTTASYLCNRKFTFSGASSGNTGAKAGAFGAVYGATFAANQVSNKLLISLTGAHEFWSITLIWVVAQGVQTLINFVLLKWLIFRD